MIDKEDQITDIELTEEDNNFFEELEEELEEFESPTIEQRPKEDAIKQETQETQETSPFKKNAQVIITESTEKAAEKLLDAFNETIANVVGAFSDIDKSLLMPEREKVKDLAKELSVLMPQLHIGKGTGLMLAVTSCYVPVVTNVIVEVKKKKNNEKSKIDISQIIKDHKKIIPIFPGSRRSEIDVLLPILINFIKMMNEKYNDIFYVFHSTTEFNKLIQDKYSIIPDGTKGE